VIGQRYQAVLVEKLCRLLDQSDHDDIGFLVLAMLVNGQWSLELELKLTQLFLLLEIVGW
jgi:hypothetical protein